MAIEVADPMEGLSFDPIDGSLPNPEAQAAADAEAAQQAQALQAIEAGLVRLVFFGLRAGRAAVARRLPEIHDEWTDPVLMGPAEASVPLLRRHMERITAIAGANPELTVFALSLLPMVMGYVSAAEKHARTVQDATPKEGSAQVEAPQ